MSLSHIFEAIYKPIETGLVKKNTDCTIDKLARSNTSSYITQFFCLSIVCVFSFIPTPIYLSLLPQS